MMTLQQRVNAKYFQLKSSQLRDSKLHRIRPLWLCSLALHGLLLWLPLPAAQPEKKAAPEKTVKVTRLPDRSAPATPAAKTTPIPRPQVQRSPTASVRADVRAPAIPTPSQPPAAAKSVATSPPSQPPAAAQTPFADFPRYPGAQPGSFGLFQGALNQASQQTPDRLEQVSAYFQQQLAAKGYSPQRQPASSDQHVAYQVTKSGVTQVLNLIMRAGQGTVIVLSDRLLSNPSQATVLLDDLVTLLTQYLPAEAQDFANATPFYQNEKEHPDSEGGFRLVPDTTPQALFKTVLQELSARNFQVFSAGTYQGGDLYTVIQGEFKRYLHLLPSQDGQGTVIVLWVQLPQPES